MCLALVAACTFTAMAALPLPKAWQDSKVVMRALAAKPLTSSDMFLQALEAACEALGAARVMRLVSSSHSQRVVEAAQRLVLHAPAITAAGSLTGTSWPPYWSLMRTCLGLMPRYWQCSQRRLLSVQLSSWPWSGVQAMLGTLAALTACRVTELAAS